MRTRLSVMTLSAAGAMAACLALATPALAHGAGHGAVADAEGRVFDEAMPVDVPVDQRPEWRGPEARGPAPMHHGSHAAPGYDRGGYDRAGYERAREDWLYECRRRMSGSDRRDRDDGVGGAIIGGIAGGVIGNRVAGRHDRTAGTIAGAAIGAVAGGLIDRAEDRGRTRDDYADYCERYLNAYSQPGYGQTGYYMQPAPMMMMVPVTMVQQQTQRPCTETVVTEEWVTAPRRARTVRHVYRPPVRDKRVRIAPPPSGKRVRVY